MVVVAEHPESGEKYRINIPSLRVEDLDRMIEEYATDQKIKSYIEKLPVSAEVKAVLFKVSKFTLLVGKTIVKIGKKILEIVILLATKYQNASIGLIIGALLTFLISLVPFLGPLISGLLGSIIMLFGLGKGLWEDLKKDDPKLASSIVDAGEIFEPLSPGVVV